jgi:hypothetical protein
MWNMVMFVGHGVPTSLFNNAAFAVVSKWHLLSEPDPVMDAPGRTPRVHIFDRCKHFCVMCRFDWLCGKHGCVYNIDCYIIQFYF